MSDAAQRRPFSTEQLAIIDRIKDLSTKNLPEMLVFLKKLASISSQSADREGVNRAGDYLSRSMPTLLGHRIISSAQYGNCHLFTHTAKGARRIAMMGHLDTVIPEGFDTLEEAGERLIGPGVADMKGGLTVMLWALRLLDEVGLLPEISVRVLVNSDEEINSPWSRTLVSNLKGCHAGFVFEMAGRDNAVVTTRIGISVFRLKVSGIASHAGTGPKPKSSAVLELAHRIAQLEALNSDHLLVNVGKISGGRAYNYVAEEAEAILAIRYWNPEQEQEFLRECTNLLSSPIIPGCWATLETISKRPALRPDPACRALFDFCRGVAAATGEALPEEHRPGGSDAAFLLEQGIPTLDGWGPIGDFDFSPNEYILIDSLAQRAALVAICTWLLSTDLQKN